MNDETKGNGTSEHTWYAPIVNWWNEKKTAGDGRSEIEARKSDSSARPPKSKGSLQQSIQDNKVSIVSLGLAALLLLTYFIVYWPQYRELQEQETKISSIAKLSSELAGKKAELQQQTAALVSEEEQYEYLLSSFFTAKELDRLFGNISLWAEDYRLQIESIQKPTESKAKSTSANESKEASIRPIHIDIEVSGRFFDYLALRNEILSIEKALSIFREEITVTGAGRVSVAFVMEVYIQDTSA
jgi:Tfp pilus assembly protein PilO